MSYMTDGNTVALNEYLSHIDKVQNEWDMNAHNHRAQVIDRAAELLLEAPLNTKVTQWVFNSYYEELDEDDAQTLLNSIVDELVVDHTITREMLDIASDAITGACTLLFDVTFEELFDGWEIEEISVLVVKLLRHPIETYRSSKYLKVCG